MAIIGSLPYTLTNGTTADAPQVMADFTTIVNAVNSNAAAVASVLGDQYNYAADTGSVNALIINPSTGAPSAYNDGTRMRTKAANTNTSTTVTVKFGTLAAQAVVIDQAGTLPPVGSIISGMHYVFEFDSTQNKCILVNPSDATGSATITQTGYASNPTATLNYTILSDGKTVFWANPGGLTGTSNATTMTWTGIPAAIQPATTKSLNFAVEDSGVWTIGAITLTAASGTWAMGKSVNALGGFTNTGAKATPGNYEYSHTLP